WWALPFGVLLGAAASLFAASRSDAAVLDLAGGRPVRDGEAARLVNIVDGLSLVTGVPVPEVRILDEPTINAMAVGRPGADTAVVITSGMLEHLDRMQLEGVIAHLLVRLRGDAQQRQTIEATTTGIGRYLRERY